ncbi:MAG: peptide chain release factor N(5)-glutamine methyltransferase [Campylobacterales bacterium]|nr:peptide chain release factor N(5)-glutamine methyltransferase [Campylobacterales bacterium]
MRIKEALAQARQLLSWVENPQKEAALLLCAHLHEERPWLLLHEEDELKEAQGYFALVSRRQEHEPLEYILGYASFYSRDFCVHSGVLVPRPETELLVDEALALLKGCDAPRIVEVGVGSGIISVMLALLLPKAQIVATDISQAALANAQENCVRFGVQERVQLVHGAYLDGVTGVFDLLVSNPPYIAQSSLLESHVLCEPHTALFGGARGDEMLVELIWRASQINIAAIACEMGYDQRASMTQALARVGATTISFYHDLAGLDRGFSATLKEKK